MQYPDRQSIPRISRRHLPVRALVLSLATMVFLAGLSPAWAVWLPWEMDKTSIEKRLNEIWHSLLTNDRLALKQYLFGFAVNAFVAQEQSLIQTLGVKSFEFRVHSVQFDNIGKSFAFVDFERISTLKDGHTMSNRFLKVFKRVNNDWKLMVNARKKATKRGTLTTDGEGM